MRWVLCQQMHATHPPAIVQALPGQQIPPGGGGGGVTSVMVATVCLTALRACSCCRNCAICGLTEGCLSAMVLRFGKLISDSVCSFYRKHKSTRVPQQFNCLIGHPSVAHPHSTCTSLISC